MSVFLVLTIASSGQHSNQPPPRPAMPHSHPKKLQRSTWAGCCPSASLALQSSNLYSEVCSVHSQKWSPHGCKQTGICLQPLSLFVTISTLCSGSFFSHPVLNLYFRNWKHWHSTSVGVIMQVVCPPGVYQYGNINLADVAKHISPHCMVSFM